MTKRTIIPIGPYHALQEEPEFFKLHVEGEQVVHLDIELGYNHRGIEKLSESKDFEETLGRRVEHGASRYLTMACDPYQIALQQVPDHSPRIDTTDVLDFAAGNGLLIGNHRQRLQGGA